MLGAIIGDIVGSPYEFANTSNPRFPLFSERSTFTDDTICTIAVADALVRGTSFKTALREWCGRYPNPKGAYGGAFNAWLHSDNPQPYNSFGNGAAMRVSPCGWAAQSEAEAMRLGMASAQPTHNHVEGLIGAATVARAIYLLRTLNHHPSACERALATLVVSSYGEEWVNNLPAPGTFDETCQGCVPLAFHILAQSSDFEDAIRRAVTWGGDSDTLAAIVGSLAEARWGIPTEIREKALSLLPAEMLHVISEFNNRYAPKPNLRNELLAHCRYYKGEEKRPFLHGIPGYLVHREYDWVKRELEDAEAGSPSQYSSFILSGYKSAGLIDFEKSDGVPISLKAVLYSLLQHWNEGMASKEAWAEFYHQWRSAKY